MVTPNHLLVWGVLVISAFSFGHTAHRIHSRENFPGAKSLVAAGALMAIFLLGYMGQGVIQVLVDAGGSRAYLEQLVMVGFVNTFVTFTAGLVTPLLFFRFALGFTGQRFPTDRGTFLRIGLPVIVGILAIFVFVAVPIVVNTFGLGPIPEGFGALISTSVDYVLKVIALYLAALLIVGAAIVAWTSSEYRHLSTRGAVLLGVGFILALLGAVIPWLTGVFNQQLLLTQSHGAVGAALGAVAVTSSTHRHGQFDRIPAAGTIGRQVTVEEMNDPVIVVDRDRRVLDLNRAAGTVLARGDAVGAPLDTLLPREADIEAMFNDPRGGVDVPIGNRSFESSTSDLYDNHGRLLGRSIVLHDVTERERREQRIQVLNRVLRHNLRNDLTVVNGYAELLEAEVTETEEYAVQIQRMASELISIGEKAREIEEVVSAQQRSRESTLGEAIERAVEEVQEAQDGCEISLSIQDGEGTVNGTVLTSVVHELIDNACRHNDADQRKVEVETMITDGEYPVSIRVADNGPGIPEHELQPLEEETETPLEHGSGLGLWLVNWGVAVLKGEIEFESIEPRGTVATLRLPSN
ncbi:MAG: ATP-binding protein [Halobacteriales archaeon]